MSQTQDNIIQGLQATLQALSVSENSKLLVGLSGGLDSVVLLDALIRSDCVKRTNIRALHVDHQLQAASREWTQFCRKHCESLDIEYISQTADVPALKKEDPKASLEALARDARYAIFKQFIDEDSVLLTAHHADDQVETFFLQLMRGAGSKGLQSMPYAKPFGSGKHLRPFLFVMRNELEHYAEIHQLAFIEDESNLDVKFDRNYLRHEVLPLLKHRWPSYQSSVLNSTENLRSERKVLLELLEQTSPEFFLSKPLSVSSLLDQDADRRNILLRAWLQQQCKTLPPQIRIEEFVRQLESSRVDSEAELKWNNSAIHIYKGKLYLIHNKNDRPEVSENLAQMTFSGSLDLGEQLGRLEIRSAEKKAEFSLRFRQGGELLRLKNNTFHSSLKNLFNASGVFPWWRSRIPLIYHGNTLVAVADLWLNADWLEQQKTRDFSVIWHARPNIMAEKSTL